METIKTNRAETRSIAIAAPPPAVLAVIGDGARLPEWAPGFAPAVRPDGGGGEDWIVESGGAEFPIRLRVEPDLGTVDILGRAEPPAGAFARVIPSGGGSEFLFTLLFPAEADPAAVAAQMQTVEAELRTVRGLCEAHRA